MCKHLFMTAHCYSLNKKDKISKRREIQIDIKQDNQVINYSDQDFESLVWKWHVYLVNKTTEGTFWVIDGKDQTF